MNVHLHFAFIFDDYLNAQRLHAKSSWWLRINYFLARIGLPILGVIILGFNFWVAQFTRSWPLLVFEFAIGLFLTFYPVYFRFKLKRCYVRTRIGSGERTFDFDDKIILLEEANAKSEVNWAAVKSFSEDKDSFLIYLAPAKMIMVPKRICPEPQLTELRDMCQRNIRT
jgi:hypothetical protein